MSDLKEEKNAPSTTSENQLFPGYASVDEFVRNGFGSLTQAIKTSNRLPSGSDYSFYNAHEAFGKLMNNEGSKIMRCINTILAKYEVEGNIKNRSVDEQVEPIVEANDVILEKAADCIDEMNGIKKNPVEPVVMQTVSARLPINGSWNCINKATFSVNSSFEKRGSSGNAIRLLTAKNIIRPQKFFKDKIDNSSERPWEPRIKDKPNSLKPLAIFLEESENGEEFSHPYEFELDRFVPLPEYLMKSEPIKPKSLEDTPLIMVSTEQALNDLLEDLREYKEISVDLEHHSYRSFMGITCLMQISTQDADYIVDTLALRDKLCILNEIFTKSSVVKIFHGADMDIQWLQRDLSLYVVNMFDTHQASKLLEYSGLSLAYLLNRFCEVKANKHFQLADWRIRPLPDELKTYAREDVHYLIYIYHKLKCELLKKANGSDNLLRSVYQRSTDICKKRYFKPILRDDSHLDFYRKCKRLFDNRQLYALRELYRWRDQISREEDESTGYVLPNHMLLQISEALPREMQGILACCNPIPPLVRANLLELHKMILRAREQSVEKPILQEDNRAKGCTQVLVKINVNSPLHCPHDLSKHPEFRDDLPTLLDNNNSHEENKSLCMRVFRFEEVEPNIKLFNSEEALENKKPSQNIAKVRNLKFLSPYDRYKLVKPFIKAEEEKSAAEKLKNPDSEVAEQSMESRIASLHAHFVKVSKEVPQKKPEEETVFEERPLVSMPGSKKRKRNFGEENDYHMQDGPPVDDLHTTVSNMNKRKKSDKAMFYKNRGEFGKQKFKKKAQKSAQNQNNQFGTNQRRMDQCGNQMDNVNFSENNGNLNQPNKRQRKRRNRVPKNQQNHQQQEHVGSQFNFAPYDYSSVDYGQFQGGAADANRPQQFKSSFRNKGRKRSRGGANAKSMSFNNKGRGGSGFKK